jgi:hypothetical protein
MIPLKQTISFPLNHVWSEGYRYLIFLRMKHLTWVGDFSPSIDSGASIDYYNVLKSYFRVVNLIVEFNALSKSGLEIDIGQFHSETPLLSHHKTSKIATFLKNRKNSNFYFFTFFHWKFHLWSFLIKINRNQSKNLKKLKF